MCVSNDVLLMLTNTLEASNMCSDTVVVYSKSNEPASRNSYKSVPSSRHHL